MASNTIRLKGCNHYDEAPANAALSPGHLIERLATGKVQKHATEGGRAERSFAIEDALQGRTKDDAYAADDLVGFIVANGGDDVNALIKAGSTLEAGVTRLISAGDGTLIPVADASTTSVVDDIIAVANESLDLTGTGDVDTHASVRII